MMGSVLTILLVSIVIAGVITSLVINFFFDEDSGTIKTISMVVLFLTCLGFLRQEITDYFTPSIDEVLQQEPLFAEIKKSYPQEYGLLIEEVETQIDKHNIDTEYAVGLGQRYIQPLVVKKLGEVDDQTLSHYTSDMIGLMRILRDEGQTECFDLAMNTPSANDINMEFLHKSYQLSGLEDSMLKLFQADKVYVSDISRKEMEEIMIQSMQYLSRKYNDDLLLITNINHVTTLDDKQKVCDIMIDLYRYMNIPTNPERMGALKMMLTQSY